MATIDPTPRAPAHRRAIVRSLAAVLLFAAVAVVGTASPARADCAPLDLQCLAQEVIDPVTETVEEVIDPVTETVEEVIDPVTQTVEGVLDPVTETVEGVLDPVTETIDEVISPILDPVEEVLDPVLDPVEDVIPPIPGGTGDQPVGAGTPPPGASVPVPDDTGPPASRTAPSPGDPSNDGVGVPDVLGASSSPSSDLGGLPDTGVDPASADVLEIIAGVRPPGSVLGFSGGAEAAKRLAFPLLLVVLAFVFVVVENRLDRRDPKLTVAARVPEVVTFG